MSWPAFNPKDGKYYSVNSDSDADLIAIGRLDLVPNTREVPAPTQTEVRSVLGHSNNNGYNQRERFVQVLKEMGVIFSDKAITPEQVTKDFVPYLQDKGLTTKVKFALEHAVDPGSWTQICIDQGDGYSGFFCDFLFAPDGTLVSYGCAE